MKKGLLLTAAVSLALAATASARAAGTARPYVYKSANAYTHAQPADQYSEAVSPPSLYRSLNRQNVYWEYQPYAFAKPYPGSVDPYGLIAQKNAYQSAQATPSGRSNEQLSYNEQPAQTAPQRTVDIGGEQVAANSLIGRPVTTPSGTVFGQVAKVKGQGSADDNLIIDINRANTQHASASDRPGANSGTGPVIVGNGTAVVAMDRLRPADNGRSLVVERSSLRPVDEQISNY